MYWITCSIHPRQTCTGFLLIHILDSFFPLPKADLHWIPCPLYPRGTCTGFLVPLLPHIQGRLELGSFFPLPKTDLYWILCFLYLRDFTGFCLPIAQGRFVVLLDYFFPIPKADMYWTSFSQYPRQNGTGFLVLITLVRLVLDTLLQLPMADLCWIACSLQGRHTMNFKADI